MRRDFDALDRTMSPDVTIELPGSSWLASMRHGYEEVGRCIMGLRLVLNSSEKRISFLHEGDQTIVRHDTTVHGPQHEVEMGLRVRVRFDEAGKMQAIAVEPDDLDLFDHVLSTVLRDSEAS